MRVLNVDRPNYDRFAPSETPNDGYMEYLEGGPGGVEWLHTRDPAVITEGPTPLLLSGLSWSDPCKFRFTFMGDGTFHILKGHATVEIDAGQVLELAQGDVVWFPRGSETLWTIHSYFEQVFTVFG